MPNPSPPKPQSLIFTDDGSVDEHAKALQTIPNVPLPDADPVFGKQGPLLRLWHS
jgi:uncharacterized protein YjlB